jgi:hypothetical protein
MSYDPTQPLPSGWQTDTRPPIQVRRRRRRWPLVTTIVVVLLLVLAVVGDRVGAAIAENDMADQIQQSGFPVKPHVTIEGFPFLTQLLAKDFNNVVITASNVPEGPLEIASLNATLQGMHIINGFSSARVDTINGTALITFAALASAGGVGQGITFVPDPSNPGEIDANINVGPISTTVVAKVTQVGNDKINVQVVSADGVPTSILGNLTNFTVSVPQLPAGVSISRVSITAQGVTISIVGHNTLLSQ